MIFPQTDVTQQSWLRCSQSTTDPALSGLQYLLKDGRACFRTVQRQAPTLAAPASAIRSHGRRLLGPFFEAVVSKVCQTKGAGTLVSLHKTFLPRGRSPRQTPVPHPYPECNLQLFSSTCCCLIIFLPFHLKRNSYSLLNLPS